MSQRILRDGPALGLMISLLAGSALADPPPPVPEFCAPDDVLPDEATVVYVHGHGYTTATVITIDGVGDLLGPSFLSPQLIVGYTPPLDPGNPNQPPGWKSITARTTGAPSSTLQNGVRYVAYDEPYLKYCWPNEVGPGGGTLIHFYGRRFREGLVPGFEGVPCTDPVFLSESEMTAISPPLDPREQYSYYAGEMTAGPGGPIVTRRTGALAVYAGTAPAVLTSVEPGEVDARGGSFITVHGENLRNDAYASITVIGPGGIVIGGVEGRTLTERFLAVDAIDGISPRMDPLDPATPPGSYDLVYRDPRGESVLPGAFLYLDNIRAVLPSQVAAEGGTPVAFDGYELEVDWMPRIGGVPCTDIFYESSERITAVSPPLAPGTYDADMVITNAGDTSIEAYLPSAFLVEPPSEAPALASVAPSSFPEGASTEVTFAGAHFHPGLTPRLGGLPLLGAVLVNSGSFQGFAPALPLGAHDADLVDAEGVVVATLAAAVEVTPAPPAEAPPPPQEIEAVYAERQARFTWVNPLAYDGITATEILRGGTIGRKFQLGGGDRSFLLPANRMGITLAFQGRVGNDATIAAIGHAFPRGCNFPAPLGGYGVVGKIDFPLYGGNSPKLPGRCPAAPAAAAEGGGAAIFFDPIVEWASINGFAKKAGVGYAVTAFERFGSADLFSRIRPHSYANRLVTGFTLAEDADRLQIDGFYEKLGEAQGLSLLGRLVHIFPEDGFEDEFTFPDAAPGDPADWHGLTYYRADRDAADPEARPCGLKIPMGDYILQIYAVNGEGDQSYYAFRDDGRDVELLIPGAPCPPYPLVRVIDVTGKRTLPDLLDVKAREVAPLQVEFTAVGHWFDELGVRHSIDAADPSYVPHDFELSWRIESSEPAVARSSGNSNKIVTAVKAIGCYRVHLTIRDQACNRSVTRTKEAIVTPKSFACGVAPYVVQGPTPDPAGIIAIAGLDPPPGDGRMPRPRELRLRVLIAAESLCGGDPRVVAPELADLQFQLVWSYLNFAIFPPRLETQVAIPPEGLIITNLCASVVGAKYTYFEVLARDLGRARTLPIWAENGTLQKVSLQWRTLAKRLQTAPSTFSRVAVNGDPWHGISPSFRMTNPPKSLNENHWQGSFTPESQTYRFIHQAAEDFQHATDLGRTRSIPVGIVPGVSLPPMDNNFRAGLNTAVEFSGGAFRSGKAQVDEGGQILDNTIQGAKLQVEGARQELRGKTTLGWCHQQEIFNHTSEQSLFNAVIFAGTIGPVPVVVWASVGLALKVAVTAQAGVVISLFDALEGGNFMTSDLFFKSDLGLYLPASIRADVLFGVVSASIRLIPSVTSEFGFHIGNRDLDFVQEAHLRVFLRLALQIKICLLSFLSSILGDATCIPIPEVEIIKPTTLIESGTPFAYKDCPKDGGGAGTGGEAPSPARGAGGGGDVVIDLEEFLPATKSSRDGSVTFDVGYQKADIIFAPRTDIYVKDGELPRTLVGTRPAWELEPSIGFLSNTTVLIAWTKSFPQDAIDAGAVLRGDLNYTPEEQNFFRAHDEIIVTPIGETQLDIWNLSPDFIVSDPRDEVPDPAARRVDGRASIAGDETHADALVAWVRVDDPDYFYLDPGINNYRVHLETTAIYARRVNFAGVQGAPRQLSTGGINIEPAVAFMPSGLKAYCVWVHDPHHVDLLGSNRGRNLVYSVYERNRDSWTPPRPVFADPDSMPGMLEPAISLQGGDYGLLAFTALDSTAEGTDTGLLGSNRFVTISRLVNGVFGPPMRVHGKCEKRVFGSRVVIEVPKLVQNPLERILRKPEWYMSWQTVGPPGSLDGAGGVMASVLDFGATQPSPAVAILADGNIRSNVVSAATSAGIQSVSLNLGSAFRRVSAAFGAGAGVEPPVQGFFEVTEVPALPDLGIASCSLANRFAGPGALVSAIVRIENDGLAGSAETQNGDSLVGLRAVYVEPTGIERVVAEAPVPVIGAGGSAEVFLTLEQPLDPVRLRVELTSNDEDPNPRNDFLECFFGTPEPGDFACGVEVLALGENETGEEETRLAVHLTWTNTVPYEEVILYRDGSMFAAIPGAGTSFVDLEATPGTHTYEIRSRIEVSKSCRVPIVCVVEPPPPPISPFRRGDASANGRLDISDAIVLLGYLFLGTAELHCLDGADADDSGSLNITDAIRILGYLFLGTAAPPAPGPHVCGSDPTEDELAACGAECP